MLNPLFPFIRDLRWLVLKKETIEQRTESLLLPILEKNRLELVDLEYIKEGGERVLRVTLDKEGGL